MHGVDAHGKKVLKKQIKRDQLSVFFAGLEPFLVGMEARGSVHHRARKFEEFGHTVRLIAPQFVKPYVKTNKNDATRAEAICEAVSRPNMRLVLIKNIEQQAVLSLHRVRQGFVKARTAQANQIRGLLSEFGLIIPIGIANIASRVPAMLEAAAHRLPGSFRQLVARMMDHLKELDRQVGELELQIKAWHHSSALVATIGDARNFKNGRQPAAWLGLVPRHHSTGGKSTLLGISKRGDCYLRTLLAHGARAVIRHAQGKPDRSGWLPSLLVRRHQNVATVALANKNARIVWALLAHDRQYQPDYKIA